MPNQSDPLSRLARLLERSRDDPAFFCRVILGFDTLTTHQEAICRMVAEKPVTVVQSANGLGKSWLAAMVSLWFLFTRKNSIVLTTAPTAKQLRSVLWGYIRDHYSRSRIPLGGRLLASPSPRLELSDRWYALGISPTKLESGSGFHAQDLLVVVDEASGVRPEIFSALLSTNPSKMFVIGNPVRTDGDFYALCQKAADPDSGWSHAKLSSFDSPHINMPRSPYGMADQGFLAKARTQFGENTPWWVAHVLGEFPETMEDTLVPGPWLDAAVLEHRRRGVRRRGHARIGVDYAEGVGRDHSVICCRDDDNLLEIVHSNTWSPEVLAKKVREVANRYQVEPRFIAWDSVGSGSDFAHRLRAEGLEGCRGFKGGHGASANAVGINLRACSYWQVRRRLDPDRVLPDGSRQPLFAVPPIHADRLRREFSALTYELTSRDKVQVLDKDQIRAKLGGGSPDLCDALAISYCWGS